MLMVRINENNRLIRLEQHLATRGVLHLRDAVKMLEVSEMTVRRTLTAHPDRFAYYGGYILRAGNLTNLPAYNQWQEVDSNLDAKASASAFALDLIKEDDTIFIDCGTTLDHLAKQISDDMALTVICYSLNVANRVAIKPKIQLILLGGQFQHDSVSFASMDNGPNGKGHDLSRFGIHKAFISAGGVEMERGVSCSHVHEALIKQQAMAVALNSFLVVDESKFNRLRPAVFAKIESFTSIITENGIR